MAKLYYYHSVMNSGKSAHIIMQVHNLREKGKNVLVMKPAIDRRDYGIIKSRALPTELKALFIHHDTDLMDLVGECAPDYVFVDEVSFLTAQHVDQLAEVVDTLGVPVFAYGLLTDYKGELFEGAKRLVELADSIRELKSPCVKCDKKATMHLRKVDGSYVFTGEAIIVGDTDVYESVCRTCFMDQFKRAMKHEMRQGG